MRQSMMVVLIYISMLRTKLPYSIYAWDISRDHAISSMECLYAWGGTYRYIYAGMLPGMTCYIQSIMPRVGMIAAIEGMGCRASRRSSLLNPSLSRLTD